MPAQNIEYLGVAPDTLAQSNAEADTTEANDFEELPAPDSFEEFNQTFREVVRLLLEGQWDMMWSQMRLSAIDLTSILLPRVLVAGFAFLFFYSIYRLIDTTLFQVLDHSDRVDAGLQNLLLKSYRVVAILLIVIIVMAQLGVDVTALLAGLSIAGIALGFAARDSLENFISGVTILIDEPFVVGDYIEVNDTYGQVDEITLRSTRMRTVRNEIMVLPNSFMISNQLINHTKRNTVRVDIGFGIAYDEYPSEAREVVLALFEEDDRVIPNPGPTVVVTKMADSSVDMMLRFFVKDPSKEVPMRWEYTEKVREALRDAEIEIPFPHLQMFLDGGKALKESTLFQQPSSNDDPPSPRRFSAS